MPKSRLEPLLKAGYDVVPDISPTSTTGATAKNNFAVFIYLSCLYQNYILIFILLPFTFYQPKSIFAFQVHRVMPQRLKEFGAAIFFTTHSPNEYRRLRAIIAIPQEAAESQNIQSKTIVHPLRNLTRNSGTRTK